MKKNRKAVIDDGMNPELLFGASPSDYDGIFEIPIVRSPKCPIYADGMVPFSKRNRVNAENYILNTHEYDQTFSAILREPEKYALELSKFAGVVTVDCSLYWDAPLTAQIANHYKMNCVGFYLQHHYCNVIPLVRWGDERTYTTKVLPEKIAFKGYEKHGIYALGTYGVIKTREEKYHFKAGLEEYLFELEPEFTYIYGAMPKDIFDDYLKYSKFIQFPDWTTQMKGGDR